MITLPFGRLMQLGIAVSGICMNAHASQVLSTTAPTARLRAFNYGDVMVTGGPLGVQAAAARRFYLALSEDDLLNGFRKRAGLPAPGKPMGGWYDPDDFAGAHPFGQFVSALARMYANTGDVRYQRKVARLVHGFHETLAPDGFFYSSNKVAREWPCYLYDKNCTGMRDAYTLTGDAEALVVLKKMTDWAVKNLPRRSDEWYTLPENLYNCYVLTRDPRYLALAKEYDYSREFYNPLAAGVNAFTPQRHAYSHVNTLSSAARAYEATGDANYLNAIENAWTFLTTTQMYASGGWGPNERFVNPGRGQLADSLSSTGADFETPCGSYANVNLDRYLLRFTGDPKYGDNMERVLLNGMLAALPMQSDGRTFYYSDYRPGTRKAYFGARWPCCSGTYAEITADYPLDIYFHDAAGIYVNLLAPSRVHWRHGGQTVTVEQTTRFPDGATTRLTVHSARPSRFALNVRMPHWMSGPPEVSLKGRRVNTYSLHGQLLSMARTWHEGDTLRIAFPRSLHYETVAPESPHRAALLYGPLLLVALTDRPVALKDRGDEVEVIRQRDEETLPTFRTRDGRLTFAPFFKVKDQPYTAYVTMGTAG